MEKKENRNSYSELPEGEETSPVKSAKKESRRGKENSKSIFLKKAKSIKEKKDPNRFSGEGINFNAKIIGIEDVFDARGNRMCQEALQKLKNAVKTSGDHKQRIILNISLNGIVIKDEKSGEVLHQHPIHKISCISQDTKDNRAFGFVYGCPQTGHRFFAIKTEKGASQVVMTLRDLFMVALELKKKELEKTIDEQEDENEQRENKVEVKRENGCTNGNAAATDFLPSQVDNSTTQTISHDLLYSNTVLLPKEEIVPEKFDSSGIEPEAAIDTLLDLQSEVSILQQGISQMDQNIAHVVSQGLGFSFSEDDVSESSTSSLPTAFQLKLDKLSPLYNETMSISSRSSSTSDYVGVPEGKQEDGDTPKKDRMKSSVSATSEGCSSDVSSLSVGGSTSEISNRNSNATSMVEDKYAVFLDIDSLPSIFDNPSIVEMPEEKAPEFLGTTQNYPQDTGELEGKSSPAVAFAELDPLGNQPYIDKKYFFQDLKCPPKKVLKDLAGASTVGGSEEDTLSNSLESLTFCDLKVSHVEGPSVNPPPKLPPKRAAGPSPPFQEDNKDSLEIKNPFNPFLCDDLPLPSSPPPPPPPPRLPPKTESCLGMSPPPPRPPSRANGAPTPPLPQRKVPLSYANRTWFSFDQDAVSFPYESDEADAANHAATPPIPSPARKLPSVSKPESSLLNSSSELDSPAALRRSYDMCFSNASVIQEHNDEYTWSDMSESIKDLKKNIVTSSPRRKLTHHSSIALEGDAFANAAFNPFQELSVQSSASLSSQKENPASSPPLPPKPLSILHSKPSPVKKAVSVPCASSSFSNSSVSVTESSNGTHSSSSLVFSSLEDHHKVGSSSEALFTDSTSSQPEVFLQNNTQEVVQQGQSSNNTTEEKPNDSSPDSIFRRKSDPFADDFFLTLHKKSKCDNHSIITKQSSTVAERPFDNITTPT